MSKFSTCPQCRAERPLTEAGKCVGCGHYIAGDYMFLAREYAQKVLEERGELIPTFFGYTADNKLIVVPGMFDSTETKLAFLDIVRCIFVVHNVVNYTMVNESWVVRDVEANRKLGVPPCEDPSRAEALTVLEVDVNRNVKMEVYDMHRDDTGKIKLAKAKENLAEVKTIFATMLPPLGTVVPDNIRSTMTNMLNSIGMEVEVQNVSQHYH